ncbi:hypothetical protein KEM56_005690 [Ascosphaera pollenicola]|nr:hypothetical protein KEM56_005690 [Ascosphaera pollenicola]
MADSEHVLAEVSNTIAWSMSFYFQPYQNYLRGSTHGLAIDFQYVNVLGYVTMSIYQFSFMYSPLIRAQYAARHPAAPEPTTQMNDLVFAVHALILSSISYSQFFPSIWGLRVSSHQKASKPVLGVFWGCVLGVGVLALLVVTVGSNVPEDVQAWAWIDVVYAMSWVKLIVTITKYIPQAWVNYKRQSTKGWAIQMILCDTTGGFLSITQLLIDSYLIHDWSGITGNPLKFWLGNVSLFFDAIFMTQHYVLYRNAGEKKGGAGVDVDVEEAVVQVDGARQPLLNGDGTPARIR